MSQQQLRARQRVDTLGDRETPWRVRMLRLRSGFRAGYAELRKSRTATIGAVMIAVLFAICLLTPVLMTHDPIKPNYRERLAPVSAQHYFGTDKFGRDIYSRVLAGSQRTVAISVAAVTFGLLIGVPFGILSGFYRGRFDSIAMRLVDGLLAFPGVLLYLLIVTLARAWKLEGDRKSVV